jgi:hypothetical protein
MQDYNHRSSRKPYICPRILTVFTKRFLFFSYSTRKFWQYDLTLRKHLGCQVLVAHACNFSYWDPPSPKITRIDWRRSSRGRVPTFAWTPEFKSQSHQKKKKKKKKNKFGGRRKLRKNNIDRMILIKLYYMNICKHQMKQSPLYN